MKLESINKIRSGYLDHVKVMFSVLEEVEQDTQVRERTVSLNPQNWKKVKDAYDNLAYDFQTLLLLGIVCHDIGKTVKWLDHARLGARMVRALPIRTIIEDNDIVKERGWRGNLTPKKATKFLKFLIEFHEIYGNFFTGEQSLLGFEPIMLGLPKHLIRPFLDTLLILTVAEVSSQDKQGYLYNSKVERYDEAKREILDRMKVPRDALRRSLLRHGSNKAEVVSRILGLAYSYSTHIDEFKQNYRSTVERAFNEVAKEFEGSEDGFVSAVAGIRKLAYALRWCDRLSGTLSDDGSAKPADGLKALIRLIWILTQPIWRAPENSIFELRFPPVVSLDVISKLKGKLRPSVLEATGSIDFNRFMRNKKWEPLQGSLSVEYVETISKEVIVLDVGMR